MWDKMFGPADTFVDHRGAPGLQRWLHLSCNRRQVIRRTESTLLAVHIDLVVIDCYHCHVCRTAEVKVRHLSE